MKQTALRTLVAYSDIDIEAGALKIAKHVLDVPADRKIEYPSGDDHVFRVSSAAFMYAPGDRARALRKADYGRKQAMVWFLRRLRNSASEELDKMLPGYGGRHR